MLHRLLAKARPILGLYVAFALGFLLGASMMASPVLAVVIAAVFFIDILRRHL